MSARSDIGVGLVAARHAARLSQRELGARVGVAQPQIARWEKGSYASASLSSVEAVAGALGIDLRVGDAADLPLAAEAAGPYGTTFADQAPATRARPVRDLGEIAARIREHGDTFRDRYHLDRIGVFGSFVFGEQTPTSDVDLLVETTDPGGFRFIEAADFAEEILGREVDFIEPHLLRDRLRVRVLKEAVYVWSA